MSSWPGPAGRSTATLHAPEFAVAHPERRRSPADRYQPPPTSAAASPAGLSIDFLTPPPVVRLHPPARALPLTSCSTHTTSPMAAVGGAGCSVLAPQAVGPAESARGFSHRMGHIPAVDASGPAVMIHAVSLGEINATRALVDSLRRPTPGLRFIVSATTETGFARGTGTLRLSRRCHPRPLSPRFSPRRSTDCSTPCARPWSF